MRAFVNLLIFVFFIPCVSISEPNVIYEDNSSGGLFPVPAVLKPNVEFWKKIYAEYSEREIIIHDSEDLTIIYEVIHLDSLFHGIQVSERLQWKKIEKIKDEYKNRLLKLANKIKNLNPHELDEKDKKLLQLFGDKIDKVRLYRAAHNIRAQMGLKERFLEGLIRSGLYLDRMRQIFIANGLPEELLILPHVESSFNYQAYSKMGAAGIWQFTRHTGRLFLKINYLVDERLDPIKATEAAAILLRKNYEELGSWPLAITAYNHGLYGMKRAVKKYGRDLGKIAKYYRSRSFGFASRNFYAEFLAALEVVKNYNKHFGEVPFLQPKKFVEIKLPRPIRVKTLLKKLNLSLEQFAELNPALRPPVLQSRRHIPKNYTIRLPQRQDFDSEKIYALLTGPRKAERLVGEGWHEVDYGETLSLIASKYHVTIEDLLLYNDIEDEHLIYAGQKIRIPPRSRKSIAKLTSRPHNEVKLAEAPIEKPEETTLDTPPITLVNTLDRIKEDIHESKPKKSLNTVMESKNRIMPSKFATIKVGIDKSQIATIEEEMSLALPEYHVEFTKSFNTRVVRSPYVENIQEFYREIAMPENGQVVVEPDETLGHFADWLEVSTQKLRAINGLAYWEPIHVGQAIWLTFEKVTPEEFHRRRLEYHKGIEEDFYSRFYVEGLTSYKVKRGENIWVICNKRFEIPYWLVKKYNPDLDLTNLMAGQEILIPVVAERSLNAELKN